MTITRQAVFVKGADDIVAQLRAAVAGGERFIGLQFKPKRSWAEWKTEDLADTDCLQVDVVPVRHEDEDLDDRESLGYVCSYDVGVREKFGPEDAAQSGRTRQQKIDRLAMLVEELHELFVMLQLDDDEVWQGAKIRLSYSPEHLRDKNMFLGIVLVRLFVSKVL